MRVSSCRTKQTAASALAENHSLFQGPFLFFFLQYLFLKMHQNDKSDIFKLLKVLQLIC